MRFENKVRECMGKRVEECMGMRFGNEVGSAWE